MSLRFEEPTPRHAFAAELEEMKQHAGEWVLLGVFAGARARLPGKVAFKIRRGMLATCQPAGSFEATTRTVDDETRLFARYVSGEQP